MTEHNGNSVPSLFERESRGGDNAERGFSFQEQVVLANIPMWLAYEGFSQIIREAMGDTEAQFFVPGYGTQTELIEAKNHSLRPSEFWDEIERFQGIDKGSNGEYRWFTLVSSGISKDLSPLVNGLRRIRLPYDFYVDGSAIRDNSFRDYVAVIKNLGRSEQDAQFLFEKVLIKPEWGLAQNDGEALFRQAVAEHLPEYENVSQRGVHNMYLDVGVLVKKRRGEPITRLELENALRRSVPTQQLPPLRPIHIHTMSNEEDRPEPYSLRFEWQEFFGGSQRQFPSPDQWNQVLVDGLIEMRRWITHNRNTRHIYLAGSRRLPAAFAIGTVFAAVAGFSITMNHRGQLWQTDAEVPADTPVYPFTIERKAGTTSDLVVAIGIVRDVIPEVETAVNVLQLEQAHRIYFKGTYPIRSSAEARIAVRDMKDILSKALSETNCQQIHLFYAGPSHLAMLLGHRLNATAPIQCYQRVSPNEYVQTCKLL